MTTTETPPETPVAAQAPAGRRVRVDLWVGVGLLAALVVARFVHSLV